MMAEIKTGPEKAYLRLELQYNTTRVTQNTDLHISTKTISINLCFKNYGEKHQVMHDTIQVLSVGLNVSIFLQNVLPLSSKLSMFKSC